MCCRPAIERVFAELTGRGVPEKHAVETALVICHSHHPEVPLHRAVTDVTRWTVRCTVP